MYLVDTNVISARAPSRVAPAEMAAWMDANSAKLFISVVTELNATLLLSPIDTQTLATQVWADTSTMAFAAAAPYAALLTGISLFASGLLFALLGKSALLGERS